MRRDIHLARQRSQLFSLSFLFTLILINGIGTTLPIPYLTLLADIFEFPLMGLVEAGYLAISAFCSLAWGYITDRFERKRLLGIGVVLWLIPSFTLYLSPVNLGLYVLGRWGMAVGLSTFSPLAYSLLADFAAYDDRGVIASGLNLSWVGSSAAGILLGGLFATPSTWKISFGVISIIGMILLIWLSFLQMPQRGRQEPAFHHLDEYDYPWRIQIFHLPEILTSRTIFWLMLQGVFALIPGTIFTYFLVSFLATGLSIPIGMASVIAITIASGRAIGYPVFGRIGDVMMKKQQTPKVRAKIAAYCMIGQAVAFFLAFMVMDPFWIFFFLFSVFFWLGSFIGGGSGPNRTSLMFEVSLPEHRGSLGALFSITDQIGAIVGIIVGTLLLTVTTYSIVFTVSLGFYGVAALAWALCIPMIHGESAQIRTILQERAQQANTQSK
ncbi:MAG: MFS transporter [Candidatus Heimdallarchaeota archaeon]